MIAVPEQDLKLLAAFAAGLPLHDALGAAPPKLDAAATERFRALVERRANGEPAAYIVGTEEFCGLEFAVSPAVLIPRPSTETLVELAGMPRRFLEIGTGSGAVAVTLALRGARGAATDISEEALAMARGNAARHGVADRIDFIHADLFAEGDFDLVISNPPYVATGEFASLPPEVLREPRLALDGGVDGLDAIRRIIAGPRAARLLLECAPRQAAAVRDLALQRGYSAAGIHKDLDGFDRVVDAVL